METPEFNGLSIQKNEWVTFSDAYFHIPVFKGHESTQGWVLNLQKSEHFIFIEYQHNLEKGMV